MTPPPFRNRQGREIFYVIARPFAKDPLDRYMYDGITEETPFCAVVEYFTAVEGMQIDAARERVEMGEIVVQALLRPHYTAEEAQQVVDWLNEREAGYPFNADLMARCEAAEREAGYPFNADLMARCEAADSERT
jgi:hypothetical protein